MKMVMVVFNEAMDAEVMETLESCAMKNYTKVAGAYGRGTTSGAHMGNDIWPGLNTILYVACEDAQASQLLRCLKALRAQLGKEGVKAFVMPVEQAT